MNKDMLQRVGPFLILIGTVDLFVSCMLIIPFLIATHTIPVDGLITPLLLLLIGACFSLNLIRYHRYNIISIYDSVFRQTHNSISLLLIFVGVFFLIGVVTSFSVIMMVASILKASTYLLIYHYYRHKPFL